MTTARGGEAGGASAAAGAPLVFVARGGVVESIHRVHVAAVDGAGRLVASLGSPGAVFFLRSCCKPHQAIPLVASGAADHFKITPEELAVACGSHNGEEVQRRAVVSLLGKAGLAPGALKCGAHEPYGRQAANQLEERGEQPSALHNNCSGNHAGMLALARHTGASVETYDLSENPAQQAILRAVSQFTGVPAEEIELAIDGCGAPTFAVPLQAAALAAARLVAPPVEWDAETRAACARLTAAMNEHPALVAGEGELDTELMRRCGGRLVSKVGAEGMYTAGVRPCGRWPRGLGLAMKIEDGDKKDRARPAAAVRLLRQLGVLNDEDVGALAKFASQTITNHRGDRVGETRAEFELV
ncbi:MAG TPA: asparaginase [Pyrinomonadaceae bacterium]|nr:asparaginase [Pyrinomonadaceae bacterium]